VEVRNSEATTAVNTVMRILFATTRGAGHVGPLTPFADASVAAGHEVLVAAAASTEPHVRRAGLPFAALDEPDEAQMAAIWERVKAATNEDAGRIVFEEVFAGEFARSALPGMLKLARRWRPDVIVRESCEFASPLVAEAVGVPDVHVACFLAVLGTTDWDLYEPLGRLRREFGLAPRQRDRSIEPYLTLAPRSLEHPAFVEIPGTQRFRAPAPRPRPLPDWWNGSPRPLVYVSFGSAAAGNGFFPEIYRDAAHALGNLPVRVLLTVGTEVDPQELGPVPANVHVEPWVPQSAVMAHASAMVGHGGSGSTLAAMSAGMPLAVVPLFADQPDNADRIAELGAGLRLDGVSGLADGVTALLSEPEYRLRAREVADEIAALAPVEDAVGLFEEIAEGAALAVA
jgi:UDP:flavonoid glycosyltransferase YjiC (YdhE family)